MYALAYEAKTITIVGLAVKCFFTMMTEQRRYSDGSDSAGSTDSSFAGSSAITLRER